HTRVSPKHPPGLYGAHEVESALNVFGAHDALTPLQGVSSQPYGNIHARALEPYLLAAAMILLLLDAIIALGLRGFSPPQLRWLASGIALVLFVPSLIDSAHADDTMAMKAALDTRLAYVKTGLADVDSISEAGLTG